MQLLRLGSWANPRIAARQGIPAAHIGVEVIARVEPDSRDGAVALDPDREMVWRTISLVGRAWAEVVDEFWERIAPLLDERDEVSDAAPHDLVPGW